ncbi:hypothetical protein HAX54_045178 [Datura stramonium]|uniref:Uncharacterized protein n=1 Tax=Datura stramonium TaxID=4076 RepID=A0ABS8WHK9_DATST|nr:hypothetical protein [Datura stramonium]
MEGVTARHTYKGVFDDHQQGEEPSLAPSSLGSLQVPEVPIDRQVSEDPSWKLSLRPEVQAVLVKKGQRVDGPSGKRRLVTLAVTWAKVFMLFCLRTTTEMTNR